MTDLIGPGSGTSNTGSSINSTTTRPLLYRVFGAIDTWFKDCSTPASQDGTAYQADFFNGLLGQLRTLIRGNGNLLNGAGPVVPEVNTVDSMMLTAVQLLIARGQPNAGADTGTADALAVAPATPWPEYVKGARIWVIKSTAAGPNATAAPTLAVSSLAPVTIVRRDGSALLPGDLPAGVAFAAEYDGAYFRLVSLTWGEIAGAVQSGKWVYGAATGTANAATVQLFPQQAPVDGTEILVKWPGVNTVAAPTFLLVGTAVKTPVRQGGGQIQPGDLSGYVPLIYDATLATWRVNGLVLSDIVALVIANAPQIVTSNPTVYYRADGNDNVATLGSNQIGQNTTAGAFRNPAAAIAWGLSRYSFAGFSLNVVAGTPGTYAHPGPLACTTTVNLFGDTTGTGQANYVLSGAGPAAGGSGCIGTSQGVLNVSGFTLNNTTMINHTVVSTGGRTNLTNCTFTQGATSTSYNAMLALGGTIGQGSGCIIQGGTYAECRSARCGGAIFISGSLTFSGTPTFNINSHAFDLGGIYVIAGADSGSANGSRFNASINGVVDSNGGGANAFSGSSAGATGSGGQSV